MIQPLLAIGDLLGLLFWLVIIVFSILSKLRKNAESPPPVPPPRDTRQRPPQQTPHRQNPTRPIRAGQPTGRNIDSEIEDFLREVRGQRSGPPATATKPPQVEQKQIIEAIPVERPVDDVIPGRYFGRDLADHVAEHITQDSISSRHSRLGDVEQTDERVEDRLHNVFDHDLGNLAHVEDINGDVHEGTDAKAWDVDKHSLADATATEIRDMLQSPDSIRKLLVISEILKRPIF